MNAGSSFGRSAARFLVLGLPILFTYWLLADWLRTFLDNRLRMAAVAVPLIVTCWLLWRWLEHAREVLLGRRYLAFLILYCSLFALLAQTSARRMISTGARLTEAEDPRSELRRAAIPSFLVTWHYAVAVPAPPAPDLLVVTLPPFTGRPRVEVRLQLGLLIDQAVERGARGIALDFYLETPTDADDVFCYQVGRAAQAGIPVFVGYRQRRIRGILSKQPLAKSLAHSECLGEDQQGSLAAVLDFDGRLRSVPLFLAGNPELPSLSLRIARALAGGNVTPAVDRPLNFLPPRNGIARFDGLPKGDDLDIFGGRFVLVGSAAEHDRHPTPFGQLLGVEIHAYAAHALRSGHIPRRLSSAWALPTLFAICYLLTAILARGRGWRRFLTMTSLASVGIVSVAILANRLALIWIDVFTPLIGIWGLAGALLVGGGGLRRLFPKRAFDDETEGGADESRRFDVFLSHNSEDKPIVRELADALEARGLWPWLDERELIPGGAWQEELEDAIEASRAAAVLIGPHGLGPWHDKEMRACLQLFVDNGKPLIPVLLPGVSGDVKLPLFLTGLTRVDLEDGLTGAGLERLIWGITGKKPAGRWVPRNHI